MNDTATPLPGRFTLFATTCAGEELARVTRPVIAPANSLPAAAGVFDLPSILPRKTSANGLLVWLLFEADSSQTAENLVLFARPRELPLQPPALCRSIEPGENESRLTLSNGPVPLLWVHLDRPETLPPALKGLAMDEEFFHMPPNSRRTITLRHPARPAPIAGLLPIVSFTSLSR